MCTYSDEATVGQGGQTFQFVIQSVDGNIRDEMCMLQHGIFAVKVEWQASPSF
jgi:hypothetical protein